jgi:MFS superfamily sulfate permease-like transporter
MELQEQISRQRLNHIVNSYHLDSSDPNAFNAYLERLRQIYPSPLIELALVEVLVASWPTIPLTRGIDLLTQVQQKLRHWKMSQLATSSLTPAQFEQITGLNPLPIFGTSACASISSSPL